jgi:hypothetical protein
MKQIIAAKTGADVTQTICIPNDRFVSIAASGLAGAEVIDIEIDLNGTWVAPAPAIQLSVAATYIQIAGPCTYRVNKPVTAGAVAVFAEI